MLLNKEDLENLRQHYDHEGLHEDNLSADPFVQFKSWFKDAMNAGIIEPNAMTLSTVDKEGIPHSRIVLLKDVNEGFTFYTNYSSQKGKEIEDNPNASLLFFWDKLARQVRLNGILKKVPRETSVEYFNSRPYGSRIGALASNQSSQINDRNILVDKYNSLLDEFPENPPCPDNWGGYQFNPSKIEFWQGRESRLHDRLVYELIEDNWKIYRLSP